MRPDDSLLQGFGSSKNCASGPSRVDIERLARPCYHQNPLAVGQTVQAEDVLSDAGQVLVKLTAAGLNYIDVHQRTGLCPNQLPYTLELEGSGEVAAVGPGVMYIQVGDRVAYTGVPGAYAEYAVVPA
jgi:NADPH2:quinone reductase